MRLGRSSNRIRVTSALANGLYRCCLILVRIQINNNVFTLSRFLREERWERNREEVRVEIRLEERRYTRRRDEGESNEHEHNNPEERRQHYYSEIFEQPGFW